MDEQIEIQPQNFNPPPREDGLGEVKIHYHHITPWVAFVIIAAIAATVGYLIWAKAHEAWPFDYDGPWSDVKSPSLLQREGGGEFAGWKTYRNEEYGYEIKYPNNEGLGYLHVEGGAFLGALSDSGAQDWADNLLIGPNDGPAIAYIIVRDNEMDYEIAVGKAGHAKKQWFEETYKESKVVVNGIEFIKYLGLGEVYFFDRSIYTVKKSGLHFVIKIDDTSPTAKSLLSTFKFIE